MVRGKEARDVFAIVTDELGSKEFRDHTRHNEPIWEVVDLNGVIAPEGTQDGEEKT